MKRFTDRFPVQDTARWIHLARRSYYYKSHPGPRGKRASTHTLHQGALVPNDTVLSFIRDYFLKEQYCAYGYDMINDELRNSGFVINKKKTYRLMDENHLLMGKVIRSKGKRKWVTYRRITAARPMEYLCLDIKYVWVQGERRWYYLLSIMDVFSRKILIKLFQKSIRKMDVINLFRVLHLRFNLKGVIIRNDNGSQFIANLVREFLLKLEAQQEFTHVATPEENAYIEAFHSVLDRELIQRFEFSSFYDANKHIEQYIEWYNDRRKHKEIGRMTPNQKWAQGQWWSSDKQSGIGAAQVLSRPADAVENQFNNQPLCISLDKTGAGPYLGLSVDQHGVELHNLNENSVQRIGG
jgi:transposase InsO family protein